MFRAFLLLFMLILPANQPAAALERSTPEAQGISSRAILGFVDAAEDSIDACTRFMLLRGGKVVAEGWWYPLQPRQPPSPLLSEQEHHLHSGGSGGRGRADEPRRPGLDHFPEEALPSRTKTLRRYECGICCA